MNAENQSHFITCGIFI